MKRANLDKKRVVSEGGKGVEEIVENSLKKAEMLRKSILKVAFEGRLVK